MQDANHNNNMMMGKADLALQYFPMAGDKITASPTPDVMDQALSTPMGGHPPTGLSSAVSIFSPKWCN